MNRWIRVQNINTYYLQYEIRFVSITLFISEPGKQQKKKKMREKERSIYKFGFFLFAA